MNAESLSALERLNQLALTPSERETMLAFFAACEQDHLRLERINTDATERMVFSQPITRAYVEPRINVLREDVAAQPFSREALLEQAPESMDGYWQVPRVL